MPYSAIENGTKREDDASDRGKTADSVHEASITSQVEVADKSIRLARRYSIILTSPRRRRRANTSPLRQAVEPLELSNSHALGELGKKP
jgi:hypothetical protein